jgi:hypothetical protein
MVRRQCLAALTSNFVPAFAGLQIFTESLILAQNERWRRG